MLVNKNDYLDKIYKYTISYQILKKLVKSSVVDEETNELT